MTKLSNSIDFCEKIATSASLTLPRINSEEDVFTQTSFYCNSRWKVLSPTSDAEFEQSPVTDEHFEFKICVLNRLSGERGRRVRGAFRIHKKTNCAVKSSLWTLNKYFRELVESRFGPEEFNLVLEGPEIVSLLLEQEHLGNCMYEVPFMVTIPGRYHVNLQWFRSDYKAVRDNTVVWPFGVASYPLGKRVFVQLGDDFETSEAWESVHSCENQVPCSASVPELVVRGRWVVASLPVQFMHELVPNRHGMYRFVDAQRYEWTSYDCALPTYAQIVQHHSHCLKRNIKIIGDSHGLMTLRGAGQGLCESKSPLQDAYPWHTDARFNFTVCNRASLTNLTFNDVFKEDLDRFIRKYEVNDGTIALGNYGHHFFAAPFDMGKLYKSFDRVLKRMDKRPLFYWIDTAIPPWRADQWVTAYADGRTILRVVGWNMFVRDRLRRMGTVTLPLMEMTLPFVGAFEDDNSHYAPFVYGQAVRVGLVLACGSSRV